MRYDKIQELSLGLIRISDELSKFRSPEKDHDEEVIIDFRAAKKSRQEKLKEKVMSTKDETPEEVIVEEEKVEEDTTKEKTKEEHVMSTIIEESDLQTMLENTKLESDLTAEIDDLMEIFMDKEETLSIKEETPEENEFLSSLTELSASASANANVVETALTDDKADRKLSRFNTESIIESKKKMKKVNKLISKKEKFPIDISLGPCIIIYALRA